MRLSAPNALPKRETAARNVSFWSSTSLSAMATASPRASSIVRRRPTICRPASLVSRAPLVASCEPSSSSKATKGATRRGIRAAAAAPETESSASPRRLELVGALPADSSLDERISSGEFTDAGSTKERASRPVRKFLALDPVGPGEIEFRVFSVEGKARKRRGTRKLMVQLVFFLVRSFGRERAREKRRRGGKGSVPGHARSVLVCCFFLTRELLRNKEHAASS